MSTRTHIVLDDGVLERIDEVRGDVPRSKWIQRVVEEALASRAPVEQVSQIDRLTGSGRLEEFERAGGNLLGGLRPASQVPSSVLSCPMPGCDFKASSPAAKCSVHGRTVR